MGHARRRVGCSGSMFELHLSLWGPVLVTTCLPRCLGSGAAGIFVRPTVVYEQVSQREAGTKQKIKSAHSVLEEGSLRNVRPG